MNHLASEKSPYLLQHANNPVDWYPWGDAAFEKARAESKPIFLSVGYSTCHWCHVMAHESFESDSVARVLNEHFVAVKVDREERPDVDRVYMTFVQATTGGGGWPMSVWLTPELEPFYGGTYFPPTSRWGRPGFLEILQEIARVWREEREQVRQSAGNVIDQLKRLARARSTGRPKALGPATLAHAVADFAGEFDRENGGFGDAPKFPRPSELLFLLREFARRDDTAARDMVLATLRAMSRGGIHDHLGGGFHRYSVDATWHVPHFEKMLYDQAQLALACLEGYQASGDEEFARTAAGILRYVSRDLGRPGGGFYSAEDADSMPFGSEAGAGSHTSAREGAFYVWTREEFDRVLAEDAELAALRFGVRPEGNVRSDPQGEFTGKNILYLARSVDDVAAAAGRPPDEVRTRLDRATARLLEARAGRPRPGRDDKVIVAWNGLMIGAFARASRVLRSSDWLLQARDAAAFIRDAMWDERDGRLLRRYRDGDARIEAYADDFACLIFGLLELFQADGDVRWLEWAIRLQRRQDELFADPDGGWFSTTGRDRSVLLRMKEDYDGAEPSASSVSMWNLLALARLTADGAIDERIERTFQAFEPQLVQTPRAMPMLLAALSTWLAPKWEVVIVGSVAESNRLQETLARRYFPFAVIVPVPSEKKAETARVLPFIDAMVMREGRTTAYVCREFACNRPTSDPAEMLSQLEASPQGAR